MPAAHSIHSSRVVDIDRTRSWWKRHPSWLVLAVAGACLLSAGAGLAQETGGSVSPSAVTAATPAKPGKEPKVCHLESVTGSRMPKRTCHTQAEWDARERAAQALVRELDAKPMRNVPVGD